MRVPHSTNNLKYYQFYFRTSIMTRKAANLLTFEQQSCPKHISKDVFMLQALNDATCG